MVASDVLLSVFGSHAPIGTISDVDDLSAALGSIAAKLATTLEGGCLGLVLAPDGKLVRGATVADDEPLVGRATALGTIGADGCGLSFGLGGAAFTSKGCGGGGDVGGSGHGLVWFGRASLPADVDKIPNRLGYARKSLNYFHGPKSGSFSPLNADVEPPSERKAK